LHKFGAEIRNHKLKREIIATQIVNLLVNRMGPVFIRSRMQKTGATIDEVVKAFVIAIDTFHVHALWQAIEKLDNEVPSAAQITALHEVYQVVKRAVTWFLRFGGGNLKVDAEVAVFRAGIEELKKGGEELLSGSVNEVLHATKESLVGQGVPEKMADEIAAMTLLSSANDIIAISTRTKEGIPAVGAAYFQTGEKIGFDWLRQQTSRLKKQNDWQARVISGIIDEFYNQQALLTLSFFKDSRKRGGKEVMDDWIESRRDTVGKVCQMVADMKLEPKIELEMLMLVSQRMGQVAYQLQQH
jgi:glutamate dehydrogenase